MRLSFNRGSVPQFGGNIWENSKSYKIRIYLASLIFSTSTNYRVFLSQSSYLLSQG